MTYGKFRYIPMRPQGISEHADLFTETDEEKHTRYRRIVQPAYQMRSILKNEDVIDGCTGLLKKRLKEFAEKNEEVDLGLWLELYAHDVIGHILFGQSFGFMERGTHVDSFIESVHNAVPLLSIVSVAPRYMRNIILLAAICVPGTFKNFKAVQATVVEAKRQTQLRLQRSTEANDENKDILSQLLRIVQAKGSESWFTHKEVTLESWAGIMAGSDSVAINLRAVLYFLMRTPDAMSKVTQELQDQQHLCSTPISFADSTNHLPYISACIKEASRLFPSTGFNLARIAPAQGITLSGLYIPAGYHIGVNAQTVQHDRKLFGEDATQFRPERWLESPARKFELEKGMIFFGAGTRTCIGKNVSSSCMTDSSSLTSNTGILMPLLPQIALAEIHKLIPELLRSFDMQMAHNRSWKTRNGGFVRQTDVIVKLAVR
jgi:cytochrome P450